MQGFVTNLYETSHTLLALACTRLGQQVFDLPRLADYLAGSVLHELCHLPDHRLIVQVRGLWRCVVWRCPPDQRKSLLYPLLATLLDHLAERLDTRWQHLRQELSDGAERDGDDPEAVVAEQLTRQLTREAVQLVATVLFSKDPLPMADDAMDDDSPQTPAIRAVSPGGQAVLRSAVLARPLLTLLFRCIGWGDSPASLKATDMSPLVVRVLVDAKLVDDAAASQLLYWLLHGLEVQGHYDTNLNSLCTATTAVYLCLRPGHADAVDQVLCQIPEVNAELVAKLNQKMFNHPKISNSDKMKREEMKRLTRPLVSRSMSQLFQKKVSIRDLLPMATERRRPAAADITSIADLFGDT